jgi:hypothetical protein
MYPSFLAVHHGCALCFFVPSTLLDWMTSSKLGMVCPEDYAVVTNYRTSLTLPSGDTFQVPLEGKKVRHAVGYVI